MRCAAARLLLLTLLPIVGWRGGACDVVTARLPPPPPAAAPAAPRFLPTVTSLVAARGEDVTFDCPVYNLKETTVSWVRSRDLQILAAGGMVFTMDARVRVDAAAAARAGSRPGPDSATHRLTLGGARLADAGRYECQLNTEPKMSLFFNLTVLESPLPVLSVEISGARRRQYRGGDTARLHCTASWRGGAGSEGGDAGGHDPTLYPPLQLDWYLGDMPIDLQLSGGVSLESRVTARGASSELRVPAHAGRYACRARAARGPPAEDVVTVEVLDDDPQMDAMQRDQSLTARTSSAPRAAAPAALAPLGLLLTYLAV